MKHFVNIKDSHSTMLLPFCGLTMWWSLKGKENPSAFTRFHQILSILSYVTERKSKSELLKGAYFTPNNNKNKKNPNETLTNTSA